MSEIQQESMSGDEIKTQHKIYQYSEEMKELKSLQKELDELQLTNKIYLSKKNSDKHLK